MKEDPEIMAQFYIKLLYYYTSSIGACLYLSMFGITETDSNLKKTGPQLFQRVIPVLVNKITKKPIKLWFFCDRAIWYVSFRVPIIRKDARKKFNSPWLRSVNLFQCLRSSKAHASQAEKNYIRSKRGGPRAVHNLYSNVKLFHVVAGVFADSVIYVKDLCTFWGKF